jgi:PAS domain S-box-containing protein
LAITETRPAKSKTSPPRARSRARPNLRQLMEGAQAFRLLVDAVVDYAIYLLDREGRVVSWNRGAERIKGYPASEIIGRPFSVFFTPQDVAAGRPDRILRSAARDGRYEDQGWRVRRDGTRFWADAIVTALRDDEGEVYGFAKVTRDMTDAHAAAEHERQLVVERAARRAAEEALVARDRFLSIASHELKTPVASLQVATEALLRSADRGSLSADRLQSGLERIDRAARRLTGLLVELLDVSRLANDDVHLDLEPVDLARLIREVTDGFEGLEGADRIELSLAPATITGDAERLEQVVTNLVDNALRYSPDGGPVHVSLATAGDGAQIQISDCGIGVESSHRETIFEPFGRAATITSSQGLGLGLFISRQIVDRHGGSIAVESDGPGTGTTFRVTLPSHPPGAHGQA